MNISALFHPVERENPTVMETIMKPLSYARRGARWLVAAGIAVASFGAAPATAQVELRPADVPELRIEPGDPIRPRNELTPFFEKTGSQVSCDYVKYRVRFGVRGSADIIANPGLATFLDKYIFTIKDQLPNGLAIENATFLGDATGPGGGAAPTPVIATTVNPNDTVTVGGFKLSASDLDGDGSVTERYVDLTISARIDPAAFPAPALIPNQAFLTVAIAGGPATEIPSHDPAIPDDGDPTTGSSTKILVDLTGCDRPPPPPPPGDDGPCFEVVRGEVDCVPGGGAFIYHMPVGADLGGKWVQLRTTTPGVMVAPAAQLVPAGGGVLSWTITGASPGDVVHLIVTGIETYAGPTEGVGLCCSQTVDIIIPPDLDCPDEQPDLKVEKRADVASCTLEGGCDFTITVTNVGAGPYNGKIVLEEVTTPGNAAVESGPNAPWACVPMMSPMMCEHPATTLNPGESVVLKLGFKPGPGWTWPAIRNCAEYDYTASGKEPFGDLTNDKACASIPICIPGKNRECTPPEEKKADIGIRKSALTPVCTPDGVCLWRIDIVNTGTSLIDGPLTVIDEYPAGAPASSDFIPSPPWMCAAEGPGRFRCDHPGIVLAPGAMTTIGVKTVAGDAFRDEIENCAEVLPVPGETNLANNRSCATARIPNRNPGQPALRITKTCGGAVAGAAISCRIGVHSVGTAAPSGPVRVNDAATILGGGAPVQIQTVTPDGAEWSCGPVPADTLSCQIPGNVMTPGTSRYFDVTLTVSPNQRFENCARASYGPAPGDDIVYPIGEACAQGGATISVEKTGDTECRPGQPCTFEITITNEGETGFSGPVRIGDALGVEGLGRLEGVPIMEISPPFGCAVEPTTLPFSCEANLELEAGESRMHQVTVMIPEDMLANQTGDLEGRNCVAVLGTETPVRNGASAARELTPGPGPRDDASSCHPFTIVQEQEQQCSPGFVLNADGRCVCPEGTTFRNGQCTEASSTVPVPTPRPRQPDPVPQQCTLLPGQVRTQDGRCVCPRGTELRGGRCVRDTPPPRQCTLLPGQIRTQDGRCVCPRGTELRNGACRTRVVECPQGTVLRNGRCIEVNTGPRCRQGQVLRNGRCVNVTIEQRCPRGTVGTPPNCRKVERQEPQRINPNINPDILRNLLQRPAQKPQQPQ